MKNKVITKNIEVITEVVLVIQKVKEAIVVV